MLVLFGDALNLNTSEWRKEAMIPGRLLGIGLPLTIVLGLVAAMLLLGLGIWEAALLATILAPTDAALGQAVITNPRTPERIRTALNVESGLNDGLALPLFFVLLEATTAEESGVGFGNLVVEILESVGLAAVVGVVVGFGGAWLLVKARSRSWVDPGWAQVFIPALAVLAYAVADGVEGSGFIGAWVAGMAFGRKLRPLAEEDVAFAEDAGHLLSMFSFFLLGMLAVGSTIRVIGWEMVVYSLLSLTLIRMLPVAAAMGGTGLRPATVAYLGWFGPRGLASMILGLIVIDDVGLEASATIIGVMVVTVTLSIVLHGTTSVPGANRYATWFEAASQRTPDMAEGRPAPAARVSRRHDFRRNGGA